MSRSVNAMGQRVLPIPIVVLTRERRASASLWDQCRDQRLFESTNQAQSVQALNVLNVELEARFLKSRFQRGVPCDAIESSVPSLISSHQ